MKNRTGRYLALAALAATVSAGCSSGPTTVKTVAEHEVTTTTRTPFTVVTTPTTTAAPTTSTTICVATDTGARLRADQAALDSLVGGRRQAESAVAQIQLVLDNAGRSLESYRRTLAGAQADYDQAAAAYADIKWDTYHDKMVAAADNLADWKGIVASWEALRTKALGDLSRGKATLADWDKQISAARQAVAADKAAQGTLTCS